MCGIAGIFGRLERIKISNSYESIVKCMIDPLYPRGPDAFGVWVDEEHGVALGHRRLSILDLSADGSQPMHSESGRYVISYNGEIYNYVELREELAVLGHKFKGGSDTEVLLAGISEWGIASCVSRANGMFAFALWDRQEGQMILCRDRFGKKPLYVYQRNGTILFASELKSLMAIPEFQPSIDSLSAEAYFRFSFVPGDQSIFEGVKRLTPGSIQVFSDGTSEPKEIKYWNFSKHVNDSDIGGFSGDKEEAAKELLGILKSAVHMRCRSDVAVGSLLSGGIDSSIVTALMAQDSSSPINTYTIGFEEDQYDESQYARAISDYLGCQHTDVTLGYTDAQRVLEKLPMAYDEPFADVSQIPTMLVSELARKDVTVCLSGDGGDEAFGGYNRHHLVAKHWGWISTLPLWLRSMIGNLGLAAARSDSGAVVSLLGRIGAGKIRTPLEKIGKSLCAFSSQDLAQMHEILLAKGGEGMQGHQRDMLYQRLRHPENYSPQLGPARIMMLMDTLSYLPDNVLVKTDRASMAYSLELRSPLLDYRVFDFAWSLPETWLVNGGGKDILKQVLNNMLPSTLYERPKMGFALPISAWLRGNMKAWAEDIICSAGNEFGTDKDITRYWREHLSGKVDHGHYLWRVLMWNLWQDKWKI